jgi:hypothetical protein
MSEFDSAFLKFFMSAILVVGSAFTFYSLRLKHGAGRRGLTDDDAALLGDLAERNTELEARVNEMEERLDFAERKLVQLKPDAPRIDRPVITPV